MKTDLGANCESSFGTVNRLEISSLAKASLGLGLVVGNPGADSDRAVNRSTFVPG